MKQPKLPHAIANSILRNIAGRKIKEGTRLKTQSVADEFGVSRSPVRVALEILDGKKVLRRELNKGYFVTEEALRIAEEADLADDYQDMDGIYDRFVNDWLNDRISNEVNESSLRKFYDITASRANSIMFRAVHEGWAERKPGYGWRLREVAKTEEAFNQIYRFRLLIEPAALLEPGFTLDHKAIERLREDQEGIRGLDVADIKMFDQLERGSQFHAELARMSGNLMFHFGVIRANKMRRLLEYRAPIDKERLVIQCAEHLEILDLIEAGDMTEASFKMRIHLDGALNFKRRSIPFGANSKM
ncbi:MAG: GntR family transcriptional regulator [Cognatishimia sp.]|uniref:GntR family transcriptional regulator n=1 Tax=Cognatishimia sp. TaxID=2211648 RepID=UPI003B8ABA1B